MLENESERELWLWLWLCLSPFHCDTPSPTYGIRAWILHLSSIISFHLHSSPCWSSTHSPPFPNIKHGKISPKLSPPSPSILLHSSSSLPSLNIILKLHTLSCFSKAFISPTSLHFLLQPSSTILPTPTSSFFTFHQQGLIIRYIWSSFALHLYALSSFASAVSQVAGTSHQWGTTCRRRARRRRYLLVEEDISRSYTRTCSQVDAHMHTNITTCTNHLTCSSYLSLVTRMHMDPTFPHPHTHVPTDRVRVVAPIYIFTISYIYIYIYTISEAYF